MAAAITNQTDNGGMVTGRLAVLRGSLSTEGPGSRGLERMARNPRCDRLRALTAAGLRPSTVAEAVYDDPGELEEQSPFAIAQGNTFEANLLRNGSKLLIELLQKHDRLPDKPHVANLEGLFPGSSADQLARRREHTKKLLRLRAHGNPWAPHLVIKPRVQVEVFGELHELEPDFLVAADDEPFYRVGEIKSYPDRGGKTDPAKVRSACRQTAVGVVALRMALTGLGVEHSSELVPAAGDLVLRIPGSGFATLRSKTLEGEVDSLERAIAQAPGALEELLAALPEGASLDTREGLESIPNCFRSSCKEHCALAKACRRQAVSSASPAVLGDRATEQLAPVTSLTRALELLNGTGAPPHDEAESRLAQRLRRANDHYARCFVGAAKGARRSFDGDQGADSQAYLKGTSSRRDDELRRKNKSPAADTAMQRADGKAVNHAR